MLVVEVAAVATALEQPAFALLAFGLPAFVESELAAEPAFAVASALVAAAPAHLSHLHHLAFVHKACLAEPFVVAALLVLLDSLAADPVLVVGLEIDSLVVVELVQKPIELVAFAHEQQAYIAVVVLAATLPLAADIRPEPAGPVAVVASVEFSAAVAFGDLALAYSQPPR